MYFSESTARTASPPSGSIAPFDGNDIVGRSLALTGGAVRP
jgi:hypothetical protein